MKLPVEFLEKMKGLMKIEEYDNFLASYNEQRNYGLRANTLKVNIDEFKKISPFNLKPIPWCKEGFYYPEVSGPGRHPYYYAGLYYIQEPSAMFPVAIFDAQPGEKVLDLCAAPGGKTVQIAAAMKGQGLLVSNDVNNDRVKALVKNIELCGVRNAIVTNETPQKLSRSFKGYFDRILVDAPCSGEGMFRKDDDAVKSWQNYKCDTCANMQRTILTDVDAMLKPGGVIVYSTCTFSPEEDELMIEEFLLKNPSYNTVEFPVMAGIEHGRPEWANGDARLARTARLWPHKLKGEGHFVAMLKKQEESHQCNKMVTSQNLNSSKNLNKDLNKDTKSESLEQAAKALFKEFSNANLREPDEIFKNGHFQLKGNNLYWLPVNEPELSGLKIAKFGWYLGDLAKGRFEPSHSMVIALHKSNLKNVIDFKHDSKEVQSYLKGETLLIEGKKGYVAICVDGYTLGWAKQTGDMLKNQYPKGWRCMKDFF